MLQTSAEYDSDDEKDLENFPFYVNKSGLPIDNRTWDRMWRFAAKIYPDGKREIEKIRNSDDLKSDIPIPVLPTLNPQSSVSYRVRQLQNYINTLQYNHTGTQFFEIRKSRPIAGLIDTAREMVKEALPIKCLEAVILGIYLTNGMTNIERFPIGFKSMFDGTRCYHIVLGLYFNGKFGAMGISRRKDLMDKPIIFKSISEMISDYETAYANYGHVLKKIRLGGPVSHDACSQERIAWSVLSLSVFKLASQEGQKKLERFTRDLKSHLSYPVLAATTSIYEKTRQLALPPRREHTVALNGIKNNKMKKMVMNEGRRTAKSACGNPSSHRSVLRKGYNG